MKGSWKDDGKDEEDLTVEFIEHHQKDKAKPQ